MWRGKRVQEKAYTKVPRKKRAGDFQEVESSRCVVGQNRER